MATDDTLVAAVRTWIAPSSVPEELLTELVVAELEAQERICSWPGRDASPDPQPRPKALDLALKRRVGRAAAARGVTLGIVSTDSDLGATRLPRWDAEIERYEAPYRVVAIA